MNKQKTIWSIVGVALLFIVALGFTSGTFVGKAGEDGVDLGNFLDIPQGPINLTDKESQSFVIPQNIQEEVVTKELIIPLHVRDNAMPQELELSLFDENYLRYSINNQQGLLALAGDTVQIHLTNRDNKPDLQLILIEGEIQVTNLNFKSPDSATVRLYDQEGVLIQQLIHLEPEEEFHGFINASSSSTPNLTVNVGTINITESEQSTFANFSYRAPAESQAVLLQIRADVNGKVTLKNYMITVGDVLFAKQVAGLPSMILRQVDEETANFTVTFRDTTNIQPFATPCRVEQDLDTIFADSNVKRVYTYNAQGRQVGVWNANGAPSDEDSLELFTGYYVELKEERETTITMQCTPVSVYSNEELGVVDNLPDFINPGNKQLARGWNLISLPGTVPRSLADFIQTDATVAFCQSEGEGQCQLVQDEVLSPGVAYWVNVNRATQMGYLIQ